MTSRRIGFPKQTRTDRARIGRKRGRRNAATTGRRYLRTPNSPDTTPVDSIIRCPPVIGEAVEQRRRGVAKLMPPYLSLTEMSRWLLAPGVAGVYSVVSPGRGLSRSSLRSSEAAAKRFWGHPLVSGPSFSWQHTRPSLPARFHVINHSPRGCHFDISISCGRQRSSHG